jgi:hypothetical protein
LTVAGEKLLLHFHRADGQPSGLIPTTGTPDFWQQ